MEPAACTKPSSPEPSCAGVSASVTASGSTVEAGIDPTRTYENKFDALPDILEGVTGLQGYQQFLPGCGRVGLQAHGDGRDPPRGRPLDYRKPGSQIRDVKAAVSPRRASLDVRPRYTWKDCRLKDVVVASAPSSLHEVPCETGERAPDPAFL